MAGFCRAQASKVNDPIRAKSLVLDDGTTRLAIVVVDYCMMPRELIDRAKDARARRRREYPPIGYSFPPRILTRLPRRWALWAALPMSNYVEDLAGPDRRVSRTRGSQPRAGSNRLELRSTIMCTPTAGVSSGARTRCSTILSASGPFEPTCIPDTRIPT